MNDLERIKEFGFIEVGEWLLGGRCKSGIYHNLSNYSDKRVIYAFVVENNVMYIGICESISTTLEVRMNRYKDWQGGNKVKALKIKECLELTKPVNIYAYKPIENIPYKGIQIDLISGLEYPLIRKFNPPWNKK